MAQSVSCSRINSLAFWSIFSASTEKPAQRNLCRKLQLFKARVRVLVTVGL